MKVTLEIMKNKLLGMCTGKKIWRKCKCGNPSNQGQGITINTETNEVEQFWCADCGGDINTKDKNIKVKLTLIKEPPNE